MSGYDQEPQAYDDEPHDYRDRTDERHENGDRARSASPNGRDRMDTRPIGGDDEEEAKNPGTNLFVTGIHPRLSEQDVTELFSKYGIVEKCNIMRDPHTKESRGFGFVNMASGDEADAAKEALQGQVNEGRTLSIEKARRARPRTPTPGRYFGPPKNSSRGPPRRREFGGDRGYGDRYDDPRRGGGGGYPRRYDDDYRGGYAGGPPRRYDGGYDRFDRGPPRRDRYDDRPPRGDRYGRDDGYGAPPRGGRDYDRDSRRAPGYADAGPPPPARDYGARPAYDDRAPPPADDRYGGR